MDRSIFRFSLSTEDALSYVLAFTGLELDGRSLRVRVKDRATSTTRATLTIGAGLTVAGNDVSAAVAKVDMASWPRGEYSADLVDITGEPSTIMAVRFVYDLPGNLVYGVKDRKAFVTWSENKAYVTATGAVGPPGPPGSRGWAPEFAVTADGERRVLQIIDWIGGTGEKPDITGYLGAAGIVADIEDAIDVRGAAGTDGTNGEDGTNGTDGTDGDNGWSPVLAVASDGERRVLQIDDWVGGDGAKPATGDYIGVSGLTPTIGDAVDIRGPAGSATIPDGDKGDITTSDDGATWLLDRAAVSGADAGDMVRLDGAAKLPAVDGSQLTNILANVLSFATRTAAIASSASATTTYLRTAGYSAVGDYGGALYKKVASEPSHAGKFQDALGAWFELVEPVVTPEMFGAVGDNSTNDTTALNNADAFPAPVRLQAGKTYLATGQLVLCQVERKRWFAEGGRGCATIRTTYNSGTCILLGPSASVVNEATFSNIGFNQDNASTQLLWEIRGVRSMQFQNCFAENIYTGFKLGTATHATYIFNLYQCEMRMRLSGHTHFIDVVNSTGQIDLQDTFVEGGFASSSIGLRIASNVATHIDHLIMMGGYFSRFGKNIYINSRVTSIQMGDGLHIEGQLVNGIEVDTNGSFENWTITGCTFGLATAVTFAQIIYVHYTQTTNNCDGLVIVGNMFQQVKNQPAIEITSPSGNRLNGLVIGGNSFPACTDNGDLNHAVIELLGVNSGTVYGNTGRNINGSLRYAYLVRSQSSQTGMVVDSASHGMAGAGTGVTVRT